MRLDPLIEPSREALYTQLILKPLMERRAGRVKERIKRPLKELLKGPLQETVLQSFKGQERYGLNEKLS